MSMAARLPVIDCLRGGYNTRLDFYGESHHAYRYDSDYP